MIPWQEGDVIANGIRIHYYRSGGAKPPIVLSHGITDSGMCWPQVAEALAEQYEVITVDARGHGKSEKPSDLADYAREEHAKDLAGFIEALGLDKPAVMGHSMGAGTSATLGYLRPELVGVMLLEDPPWRDVDVSQDPQIHSDEWRQQIVNRKKMTKEELIKKGKEDNPKWPNVVFDKWSDAKFLVSEKVVGYITTSKLTWEVIAAGIKCPTLLITADPGLGAIVTHEIADSAVKANGLIQVANIPNAGHNIRREGFADYITAVKKFLDDVYPA